MVPTPATTEPTATAPAAVIEDPTVGAVDEETADAFAHGWFSDDAAFPQVALWGLVLTAIGIGSYLLSRSVRRNWVGALAGIVPVRRRPVLLLPEHQPAAPGGNLT